MPMSQSLAVRLAAARIEQRTPTSSRRVDLDTAFVATRTAVALTRHTPTPEGEADALRRIAAGEADFDSRARRTAALALKGVGRLTPQQHQVLDRKQARRRPAQATTNSGGGLAVHDLSPRENDRRIRELEQKLIGAE